MADLLPGLFNRLATQGGAPGLNQRVMQGGLVRAGDPQGDPMALARALMAMNEGGQGAPQQSVTVPAMPPMPSRQGGYGDAPAAAPALPSPTAATQPQIAAPAPAAAVPPMPEPVTVRDDVIKAAQQLMAQRLLPEQWKGAWQRQYGEPV